MPVLANQNALDVHSALLECLVSDRGASTDMLRMTFTINLWMECDKTYAHGIK